MTWHRWVSTSVHLKESVTCIVRNCTYDAENRLIDYGAGSATYAFDGRSLR
jgi:hypothetical protein